MAEEKKTDKKTIRNSSMRDRAKAVMKAAEDAAARTEAEHRRKMLRHRIDVATAGVRAYRVKKMGEAVKNFLTYLHILEDWKGVGEGGLTPNHFKIPDDTPELLLISGVYWDLVKLYDRTDSAEKQREFYKYLEKYILFSKGMPFQALCGESLRKYISNEKPRHRAEFKNAYKMMTGSPCFVATSLIDVSDLETLPRLRVFRDETLMKSRAGRAFVEWYYRHGESFAARVDGLPEPVRVLLARALDVVAKYL